MPNNSSSSTKAPKSVKKRPSKTLAKGAKASKVSKDSDKKTEQSLIADDTSDTVREDQTFGQGELKDVNEYLKGKVGADINAKKWLEGCSGLDEVEKSEVIIRLVYEICLTKNIEYDLEGNAVEDEKGSKKDRNFDTRRIFEILKKVNRLLLPEDCRRLVEFICQKDNIELLEMICKQEEKDEGRVRVERQYPWKGEFTGYERLTDLLQYVLEQRCSSEIVLCIAKKVFGQAHIFYSGQQYLSNAQVTRMKGGFDYEDSVIKDCLEKAIKLGYKGVVLAILGGDIYHCIRLMEDTRFQEEIFCEALGMIEEAVADVISSWVEDGDKRQSCKDEIQDLLEGKLKQTIVGALISTLCLKYQDEFLEVLEDGKQLKLRASCEDKMKKKKEINELNSGIDDRGFVKNKILKSVKLLNSSSYLSNSVLFREVLEKIVNNKERFDKLKAVYAAICKGPMEELLDGAKVHEDVVDTLKFFDVKHNQVTICEKSYLDCSAAHKFNGDIKNLVKKIRELNDLDLMEYEILVIAKGLASGKVPAFSGLSRRTIIKLKNKKGKTDDEANDLKEKVLKIMGEIKEGIDILAKGECRTYIEDVFRHFKVINSEIEKKDRKKIVELVCQNGNVELLKMICQEEKEDEGSKINRQYPWKGEFTGYKTLPELLQYVLSQSCSPKIALCIAKKVFGQAHIFYSGQQYLSNAQVTRMKGGFDYEDSVIKDCLEKAIKLGYKGVVLAILGGDIYHCIRLMEDTRFQEEIFCEALGMIEEAVADVISSWVSDPNEKKSFRNKVLSLLRKGIEVDIKSMDILDLIFELEHMGEKLSNAEKRNKSQLVKKLEERGEKKGLVKLKQTIVGALISTLCLKYQDEFLEVLEDGKQLKLKISLQDMSRKEEKINELNGNINNKNFLQEEILKSIKLLNSSSYLSNSVFFREVLEKIVNNKERFDKLKAVCAAICKGPMEELLRGAKVREYVVDALKFFGVDIPSSKIDLSTVESVETMDLNEYTSPSSATETNKLSGQDIVDIAKYSYRWMEPINGKYLEDTNEEVFFTCTDVSSLEDKLKHYKEIKQKDLIFTSIINTGKEHWVTLVVARSVKDGKFSAYYCDSFGKGLSKKMSDVLKKALEIDANRISSSQIKQQKDEYNCGIFALANADKITRIIKDKSFTEINVELKGKLDAGQLRKEFAKKVEEMRQSERNSEANSEDESVIMQDSVENVSRVLLGPEVAEKKNEEVMQNNCRQNQSINYNKKRVHIAAPIGSVFNKVKIMECGSTYAGESWDISTFRKIKKAKRSTKAISFPIPKFSEFVDIFGQRYSDELLEYEFDYERLGLLSSYNSRGSSSDTEMRGSVSTSDSEGEDLEEDVLSESNDNVEHALGLYNKAIKDLKNGKKDKAISELKSLSERGMPHAQYALAIIRFKDLWTEKVKHKEPEPLMSQIISWLNGSDHDEKLRPLNKSLLLRVQLYDIGGYGDQVYRLTGLTKDTLLEGILSVTRDTTINFDERLVKKKSSLGEVVKVGIGKTNDFHFIIRSAMYEVLKLKILGKNPYTCEEHSAMEDAFSKICTALPRGSVLALKMFDYIRAEMIYGYAIKLLMCGKDDKNKKAIGLLNESCKLGHHGALYLRGTLLYRSEFKFIFEGNGSYDFRGYFNDLEKFAMRYRDETVIRMVANEYLKQDSYIVKRDEKKASEILVNSGFENIWKDFLQEKQKRELSQSFSRKLSIPSETPSNRMAYLKRKGEGVQNLSELPTGGKRPCYSDSTMSGTDSPVVPSTPTLLPASTDTYPNFSSNTLKNSKSIAHNINHPDSTMLSSTPLSTRTAKGVNRSLELNSSPSYSRASTSIQDKSPVAHQLSVSSPIPLNVVSPLSASGTPNSSNSWNDSFLNMPSSTTLPTQTAKDMNRSLLASPNFGETTLESKSMSVLVDKKEAFNLISNNPPNKHLGIFLFYDKQHKVKRLNNPQDVVRAYSSGIEVILDCREENKAEPDVLDLAMCKFDRSKFQGAFNAAINLCKEGKYDNACELYHSIIKRVTTIARMNEHDPKLAYYNQGVVRYKQGKYGDAIKMFQSMSAALNFSFDYVASYNIAAVLCKQEKYNDALAELMKVQAIQNLSPDILLMVNSDIGMLKKQISRSSNNPSTSVHDVGLEHIDTSISLC